MASRELLFRKLLMRRNLQKSIYNLTKDRAKRVYSRINYRVLAQCYTVTHVALVRSFNARFVHEQKSHASTTTVDRPTTYIKRRWEIHREKPTCPRWKYVGETAPIIRPMKKQNEKKAYDRCLVHRSSCEIPRSRVHLEKFTRGEILNRDRRVLLPRKPPSHSRGAPLWG